MRITSARKMTPEELADYRARLEARGTLKPGEKCQHPDCTGVHSHRRPRSEWCPRTHDLDRDWDSNLSRTHYKMLWALRTRLVVNTEKLADRGFDVSQMPDPFARKLSGARWAPPEVADDE